jgi:two-component system OmpR family response regulator
MIKSQLLIIEDDYEVAASISSALEGLYRVHSVHTGADGVAALAIKPDLVLLDLGLPDMHGLAVLEEVRRILPRARVCIMTAFDALETKLAAFAAGSDDYLIKPFALEELLARVEALLRRTGESRVATLIFGDTCIFRGAPLVQRGGKQVQLIPMEHRLLLYLAERPGEVVSRSELLDEVWQGADRYPNTVDVHIESLRKKIDIPFKRKSIRTAYRQGYFFEP